MAVALARLQRRSSQRRKEREESRLGLSCSCFLLSSSSSNLLHLARHFSSQKKRHQIIFSFVSSPPPRSGSNQGCLLLIFFRASASGFTGLELRFQKAKKCFVQESREKKGKRGLRMFLLLGLVEHLLPASPFPPLSLPIHFWPSIIQSPSLSIYIFPYQPRIRSAVVWTCQNAASRRPVLASSVCCQFPSLKLA